MGHETEQVVTGTAQHFSDTDVARQAWAARR
jgi:hypothetical protein